MEPSPRPSLGGGVTFTMDPGGLPDGAIGFINFVDLTFYTEGGNEDIDEVITEDAENFGEFNPANIVEGTGLVGSPTSKPVIVGSALAQILAGATVVFDFSFVSGTDGYFIILAYDSPDFNFTWQCAEASVEASFTGSIAATFPSTELADLALGAHRAAWTIESSGVKVSTNGGAVVSDAGDPGDFALLNAAGMEVIDDAILRSIAIYPPMNDAEMQAISA